MCARTANFILLLQIIALMAITIKEIAELAGVSRGSVDRVLHNRGNISPAIKEKIEKVLKEINYKPNVSASLLAKNKTSKILIIIPRADKDQYWELPTKGIKEGAKLVSHYPIELEWMTFNNESDNSFKNTLQKALISAPDAILLAPELKKESQEFITKIKERDIPIVTINTQLGDGSTVPYIGQDSLQSGTIAGRLFDLLIPGIRDILIINMGGNTENAQHVINKEAGLRLFFADKNNKVNINTIEIDNYEDTTQVRNIVEERLDGIQGIFVTNSRIYKLENALRSQLEKRDIKLIGYDLIAPNVKLLKEGFVSFLLNQNPKQQGLLAINMLTQKILFKQDIPLVSNFPIDIIIKENCDYFYSQ